MSIHIDRNLCIGCGRFCEVCPGNLIKQQPQPGDRHTKAEIKCPQDCWGCTSCLKECPRHAIKFFLGADVGGRGSILSYQKKGSSSIWRVKGIDGTFQEITVNTKEANKY